MIFMGSLDFSPVYKSHCCAFGKVCEEEGYPVRCLFSGAFSIAYDFDQVLEAARVLGEKGSDVRFLSRQWREVCLTR
jgi:hypothetical protein